MLILACPTRPGVFAHRHPWASPLPALVVEAAPGPPWRDGGNATLEPRLKAPETPGCWVQGIILVTAIWGISSYEASKTIINIYKLLQEDCKLQ
jgi:hypothetical protein